jgi:hypothetical protein
MRSAGKDNTRWTCFATTIREHLAVDDDPCLWEAAIDEILTDAEFLCRGGNIARVVLAELGRCSHWLRPHQTRWTADGGFAWPTGYGGVGFSRSGLPEFDWSCAWRWDAETGRWALAERHRPKGCLVLRVALPARTRRHLQAAVHTVWTPGSPADPRREFIQFYGFRRRDGDWICTAYQGDRSPYEDRGEVSTSEERKAP